jgi:tRNA nucleotidyltransferase (CCA-adding enzyme)
MNKNIFLDLTTLFNSHGFRLYMIGGTSRDYLLGIEIDDYDFVTDATPEEMKTFLLDADYTYEKYGTVKAISNNTKVDIVTFREEGEYLDFRHPSKIQYVKTIEKDYVRRDFTINAIYIDEKLSVHDFAGGLDDLKNHVIRFIGDPKKRVQEDPLRILRAYRFQKKLGFEIEKNTLAALKKYEPLLKKINIDKINLEKRKLKKS